MKLCRFDLLSEPGVIRAGMVYGGKVYETEGSQPVAIHEWTDARLHAPVGLVPSVRLFDPITHESDWTGLGEGRQAEADLKFSYLNASTVIGPQSEIMPVSVTTTIACKPCLVGVVSANATLLTPQEAEDAILGLTLGNIFFASDLDRIERSRGQGFSRSHDLGICIGPAITTPDELEDATRDHPNGRIYDFTIHVHVNELEVASYHSVELPFTLSDALSFASESCAIRSGDLICLPLGTVSTTLGLQPGDEVRVVSDRLGTLANRVA